MPELKLDDQQFQSLPTPSITELSMDALLESVIKCVSLNCSLAPETATDWLYLDWHLAHGMACNDAACFKQHAKLKESYEPTCGFTTIRMSSSTHWSKIALKLVRLEDDSNCDILGTSHEKTTGDETDVIDSARQASVLNEDGEDESTRLWQNIRTRDEKQRMYENRLQSRTLEANLEARHLKIPAMQTDSSAGKTSCQGRTLRESGDTLQTSHSIYPIAEVVLREEDLTTQPRALRETRSPSEKGPGSISTLDDLAFFVQARKGVCRDNDVVDNYQNSDNKPQEMMEQVVSVPHATARFDDEGKQYSIFGPHEHTVLLSKEIRNLMTTLATDYRGLLVVQDIFGKETIEKLDVPGQLGYDSQGNSLIMNLMKRSASEPPTQGRQLLLRGLTALHALRYTALNLCTYGIQVAHLYLENLFHRISFLEELILNSRVELEDAYNKVERGIYQDHPKLEHLEKILKERGPSHKILLVADRRAFFTLFRKLLSSGCNPYQIDRKEQYLLRGKLHPDFKTKLTEEINDSLRFSNCLLVPCAYITDSFPIENFTMVIQYAGCANDASVEDVLRRGNCEQHILEVHLYPDEVKFAIIHGTAPIADDGNHQAQDRLSEKILKILEPTDNSPYQSDSGLAKMSEVSPNANDVTACNVKVEATPCSSINGYVTQDNRNSNESGQPTRRECDMTIVANVSEQSEHKLAERRGLYQKILCLEKNNIQFVEREFRLPVDLVLSPATCLVIYTWQILQKLVQKVDSKQISLRNEIETILKAISFSYQNCILIFEGPTDFTSAVLDVLCDIQAIAIFFGLHVQWFTSDGLEVTDKIVMKSIEAARQSKLLEAYPAMTEAPTIAEAFLTEFPSVNPLTAHAVLSSGCPLRTFFSVTLDQQFALVEGFGVPKHSLELFKAQCVFREVGTPDRSNWLRISSQTNQKKVTHDDLKDVGMSDRQRNVPLTSDFTGITNLLTYKEPDIDLDIYSPLSDREKDFESWRRNLELPNIFEEDGDARMEKSRKTVSFSETTLFREFPPASEVTGDPKPTAMDFELKEDYLPPKCNNVGHRSHEFVDQESFRSEEEPVGLSTPFDDILSFLQPTHREEGRFVPSRHKLGTSLSTWGEDGSGRRMFYSTNDKNIEQSTGSVDSESPLTPNTFSAFEDFFISTDKQGSQNGKPQSSIPSSPCSSKPASKKQLSQTSLDRFRYQAQDSKISRSSKTAPRFSKNYPRDKERNLCTPRSSLVRSYVPADKKSKKVCMLQPQILPPQDPHFDLIKAYAWRNSSSGVSRIAITNGHSTYGQVKGSLKPESCGRGEDLNGTVPYSRIEEWSQFNLATIIFIAG
ncbi:hypothetical protein AXG93_424s1060 [Marchantia polymorpha subsp. ruderalis]|uniref:Uncharacterized protein n=1 Tax=Marchantia polymorpha subsp. ruderalis TaxID=1480154 RepID=A0A176WCW7_MARPO|nr:hypothetical protein AXG93_424s1060 [Marchantia polymorpha subsp. ruderalis]